MFQSDLRSLEVLAKLEEKRGQSHKNMDVRKENFTFSVE